MSMTPTRRITRALAAGARSLEESVDTPYGDRRAMMRPIGTVRSTLAGRADAPKQGREGAPDAWLEIDASLSAALDGLRIGDEVVVITWLHLATARPSGSTRATTRPNPLGLHRVTVRAIDGTRLQVGPLEAIDGTPIVDVKTSSSSSSSRDMTRSTRRYPSVVHDRARHAQSAARTVLGALARNARSEFLVRPGKRRRPERVAGHNNSPG
jgi:tRNA (Thr-GGU) A37 N-methylase